MFSVIPYFDANNIGPIQPWGFFVACGCALGIFLAMRRSKSQGLDPELFSELAIWILVGGFIGARAMHVFLYRWVDYQDNLVDIFKIWEGGLSSYGGFVGSTLAGIYFMRWRKLNFWVHSDVAMYAFMWGWTVARFGCFVIHDHPGRISHFFLATEMKLQPITAAHPMIQPRHDLGLYDGILTLAIAFVFLWAAKKPRFPGFYLGWGCVLYAIPRFFLDFLRATDLSWSDTRYVGLTPAQYGSIILLALGGWIIWSRYKEAPQSS